MAASSSSHQYAHAAPFPTAFSFGVRQPEAVRCASETGLHLGEPVRIGCFKIRVSPSRRSGARDLNNHVEAEVIYTRGIVSRSSADEVYICWMNCY